MKEFLNNEQHIDLSFLYLGHNMDFNLFTLPDVTYISNIHHILIPQNVTVSRIKLCVGHGTLLRCCKGISKSKLRHYNPSKLT